MRAVRLRLIRHATLELDYAGRRLLLDPMLDPAGARGPVANTPNDRRNPLVELPEQAGLRLTTNVVGCPADDVHIGMKVKVAFEHRDPVWA